MIPFSLAGWTEIPMCLRPGWWKEKAGVATNPGRADDRGRGGQEQPYIYNGNLLRIAHLRWEEGYAGDTDLCGQKGMVMPAEQMYACGKIINASGQ